MPVNGLARASGLIVCAMVGMFGGCARSASAQPMLATPADRQTDWRRVATPPDRARLRSWRGAWLDALAKVRGAGLIASIEADPSLFDPDHALPNPVPPAGRYRCQMIKLGANGTAMRDLTRYPVVDCRVDVAEGVVWLYKVDGTQRPVGTLYDDTSTRAVFLGTMLFADEQRPLAYGRDGNRDLAGYVERIEPERWRMVLPSPRFESLLNVVEIVPAK